MANLRRQFKVRLRTKAGRLGGGGAVSAGTPPLSFSDGAIGVPPYTHLPQPSDTQTWGGLGESKGVEVQEGFLEK